jgi:uncharacterized protein
MRFARLSVLAVLTTTSIVVATTSNSASAEPATDLFISEYVEGSGFNKAIEIYNGTGAPIDLSAGGYTLELYSNGVTAVSQSVALNGTIADGDVYVVSRADADPMIVAVADQLAPAVINWNGDDAVVLRKSGSIVDSFGQVGVDPGSEWAGGGLDDTLRRASSVCAGDTDASNAFSASSEWVTFAINTFGGLGAHTADCDGSGGGDDPPPVRFNELHYDNDGTDAGEAIEVVGPAGTDLTGWSIVLYNGNGGAPYTTTPLSGTIPDLNGTGTGVVNYPISGIQNGAPDGMALVDGTGTVVEFLSYEGTFAAVGGPAGGLTSTDIGVAETGSERTGLSLQRDAAGAWSGPKCASFGSLNDPAAPADCPIPPAEVTIPQIQGSGVTSPYVGAVVTFEGIVVGDYQHAGSLGGFQVQDPAGDGDQTSSDGVFVFHFATPVAVGDHVRVTGTVVEFTRSGNPGSLTQITNPTVDVLSTGNPLPAATAIEFPVTEVTDLEAYESMLATFPQDLVVSEYFNFDRFGELMVALPAEGQDRPFIPTAIYAPDTDEAQALADLNVRSRITVDDAITAQNPAAPVNPFTGDPFTLANRFRGGDVVTGLTGPTHFDFGLYRVLPTPNGHSAYVATEAPAAPDAVGGDLRIASLNALNYFLTLTSSGNVCGPTASLDCRGADTALEFERQRTKLLNTLVGLDADIIGLNEVENTVGVEPLADLAAGLNDRLGAGTYAYVAAGESSVVGSDAIKVGILYRTDAVSPIGDVVVLDDPDFVNPFGGELDRNRAAVAASFVDRTSGGVVSVVVNHLKSKGSACPEVDPPELTLAGNCDIVRTAAAEYLAGWIDGDPTGVGDSDWMIIGDLNSYDKEAPVTALAAAGFTDLQAAFGGEYAYSYLFDAQFGYLDYTMSSSSLTAQVTGATEWHINADEADVFDYDMTFKSAYQDALFDPTTPFRSSDHDAALSGLALDVDAEVLIAWVSGEIDALEADGSLNSGQARSVRRSLDQALRQLDAGHVNGAVGILAGVSSHLSDLLADGVLTAEEGDSLIAAIDALRAGLS